MSTLRCAELLDRRHQVEVAVRRLLVHQVPKIAAMGVIVALSSAGVALSPGSASAVGTVADNVYRSDVHGDLDRPRGCLRHHL